jgi:BirA family transcriptional regulator, biotin operon repressor / biotin---[acetyl-CoA-carboxylase] ligase
MMREVTSFGAPHRHFRVTDSTNARARELVEAGAPGGTIVTAAEQTAGRGRQGRTWTAPPGKALLYSAILRPLDERHLLLPLAVPLAVCEAAEELEPEVECQVKWPNDVWIDGRKLAGVLIEAKPQDGWAVIGIGLNLSISPDEFPPDLRDTAVSLFGTPDGGRESPRRCLAKRPRQGDSSREAAADSTAEGGGGHSARRLPTPFAATEVVNRHLDLWVTASRADVLSAWRARDALRGRKISWNGGSGVADGIEDSGDLVVVAAGGDRVVLGAGEVHLRL